MSIMYGISKNNKGKIEKHSKIKEGKCIFPFMYKWKTHNNCIPTSKGEICATSISLPRRTLKTYGYCEKKNKTLKMKYTKKSTKKKTLKTSQKIHHKKKLRTVKKFLRQKRSSFGVNFNRHQPGFV